MSDLTTLTGQLASMKQAMIDRLTAQGVSGYTMSSTMADIVAAYNQLQTLNYQTTTITENGTYVSGSQYTGYNNFVVNVPSGGPASHKKYNLLDRVREDVQGDTIGTVVGFHIDANDVEYAIVALDAAYRLASGQYMSSNSSVTNLPQYQNAGVYGARETATFNCDKIMDWVNGATGRSSTAVEHCRSKSFTIAGDTYIGQLPTLMELLKVLEFREAVNTADPTAADNPTLVVPNETNMWSSSQCNNNYGWYVYSGGSTTTNGKNANYFVLPVLEIPNANS